MRLQSKNLNKLRAINLCYTEILIQVIFLICFFYPALYRAGNNIHAWVDLIQMFLGLFDSIRNHLTVDYYILPPNCEYARRAWGTVRDTEIDPI